MSTSTHKYSNQFQHLNTSDAVASHLAKLLKQMAKLLQSEQVLYVDEHQLRVVLYQDLALLNEFVNIARLKLDEFAEPIEDEPR